MRVAVIGSRNVFGEDYKIIEKYIPKNASEIVSGGARGVDEMARRYAKQNNLLYKEFTPPYELAMNKKYAPLYRNKEIIDYADIVLAFWDGYSKGTAFSIEYSIKVGKPINVYILYLERKKLGIEID